MTAKLFVTDMDGTLLNKEKKITPGVKAAIRKAVDHGVVFTIATGRMHKSAVPYAEALGIDVPIITYNGAVIRTVSGKDIFTSYLDEQVVKDLLDFALAVGVHIQLYSDEVLYYPEENDLSAHYRWAAGVDGCPVGRGIYQHAHHVPKMLIMGNTPEETDTLVEKLQHQFGNRIEALKSAPTYIELIKPGINKASSIAKLAEILKIPQEQVLSIGDSNNDISMIEAAGYGVAMGNANADVKAVATYTVADCEHDGLAEALERFCY